MKGLEVISLSGCKICSWSCTLTRSHYRIWWTLVSSVVFHSHLKGFLYGFSYFFSCSSVLPNIFFWKSPAFGRKSPNLSPIFLKSSQSSQYIKICKFFHEYAKIFYQWVVELRGTGCTCHPRPPPHFLKIPYHLRENVTKYHPFFWQEIWDPNRCPSTTHLRLSTTPATYIFLP